MINGKVARGERVKVDRRARKVQFMVYSLSVLILVCQIVVTMVNSMYVPNESHLSRRQDDIDSDNDGEELDSHASSPYGNQEDGGGSGGANDGYGDNEPDDGPYGETPRDEEGQADLERFFDDHLGASEKDGMDKENLPSNLVATTMKLQPDNLVALSSATLRAQFPPHRDAIRNNEGDNYLNNLQKQQNYDQQSLVPREIETRYFELPNNKLIITRQITRGPIYKGGLDIPEIPPYATRNSTPRGKGTHKKLKPKRRGEILNARGSAIVATEDDDFDRVYVTKLNDKPFKIDALGGYDPEEDFKDASKDFEESGRVDSRRRARDNDDSDESSPNGGGNQETQQKDISFNDPEPDMLFNDASETDEVTFDQDDPYQTDLEAEMHSSAYDQPGKPTNNFYTQSSSNNRPASSNGRNSKISTPVRLNDEDSEGGWVNDGVDEMDIPSQSHQDVVLAKAAKQEELARQAAEEKAEAEAGIVDQPAQTEDQSSEQNDDPDNQRQSSADYLKDDLKGIDQEDGDL